MLAKSLQIITGLLGCALRAFALAVLVLETCWGVLLASVCLWVTSQGTLAQQILSVVTAVLLVSLCAIIIGVYYAALSVIRKAVTDAGLGREIFNRLFGLVGVTGDDPGEADERASVPTHLSKAEVEEKLNAAARLILNEEQASSGYSAPLFWLARQIQKIAVWATVRVTVKAASHDGKSVNLFELRDRLAGLIDQRVIDHLRLTFWRLSFSVIGAASSTALLAAYGILHLPF